MKSRPAFFVISVNFTGGAELGDGGLVLLIARGLWHPIRVAMEEEASVEPRTIRPDFESSSRLESTSLSFMDVRTFWRGNLLR